MCKKLVFGVRKNFPDLSSTTCCVILGKSFALSELHFFQSKMKCTHLDFLSGIRVVLDDTGFGANHLCIQHTIYTYILIYMYTYCCLVAKLHLTCLQLHGL